MLGFNFSGGQETQRLSSIIERARYGIDKRDLEHVIRSVEAMRPTTDYEAHCEEVRRAYVGDQARRIGMLLSEAYPRSARYMPIVPVGVITVTAEIDAQAYRTPPKRRILVDGEEETDTPRALAFAEMVKRSQVDIAMRELERVTSAVETGFLRVTWAKDARAYGKQRPVLRVFWPHHVWAVASPESPDRIASSSIVVALIAGRGTEQGHSGDSLYEVWTQGADGVITYRQITSKGETVMDAVEYRERDLPWICTHVRLTQGTLYATPDRDLLAIQDQVNLATSDGWYRHRYQSHRQLFISGLTEKEGQSLAYGPDAVMTTAQPGVTPTVLDMQATADWQESVIGLLKMHAHNRRQPVSAWHTKGGNPESGDALAVRNSTSEQKRAEHRQLFAEEEQHLLRIMARITDTFGDVDSTTRGVPRGTKIDGDGVEYVVEFETPIYDHETIAQKSARLLAEYGAGVISREEVRADLGRAEQATEDDEEDDERQISGASEEESSIAAAQNDLTPQNTNEVE